MNSNYSHYRHGSEGEQLAKAHRLKQGQTDSSTGCVEVDRGLEGNRQLISLEKTDNGLGSNSDR